MTSDFTRNSTERNFISVTQLTGSMTCSAKVMLRSEYHRSDGTSQLNLQCFVNGSKVVIPLGIWIHAKYYNKKQREVRGHERANDINMDLRKQLARANDIFINYRLSGQQLTGAIFRAEFSNGDTRVDFVKFYESKLAHRKKVIEHGTYKPAIPEVLRKNILRIDYCGCAAQC